MDSFDCMNELIGTAIYYGISTVFFVGVASVTVHACNSMGIGPTSRLENQLVNIEQRISSLETKIQQPTMAPKSDLFEGVYIPEGAYLLPSTGEETVLQSD